jgi:serine/threonine-protein kinase
MVRALDRGVALRPVILVGEGEAPEDSLEARLRWATGDDYEILSPLGSGTFGSVWRVRDLSLGREVALKMLHPHIARDGGAVARFRREAQLAAQLAHPGIVPIYDFDTRGSVSWYTMELAEGGSVADLVRRSGRREFAELAPQVEAVLEGLAAAHAIGVIHRDLKPENVLIDRYRRWRLSDFGIASALGEDVAGTSGTPAFAPPEQLLGEPQGPAADCFALAAIAYFALTAQPPFGDVDGRAILARQLEGRVDLDGFEPAVAEWLRRGLAADPDARFGDATEMQHAWRAVRDEVARGASKRGLLRRIFA